MKEPDGEEGELQCIGVCVWHICDETMKGLEGGEGVFLWIVVCVCVCVCV
jgi:hypothetical protein